MTRNRNKIIGYIIMLLSLIYPIYILTSLTMDKGIVIEEYEEFIEINENEKYFNDKLKKAETYNDSIVENIPMDPWSNEYEVSSYYNINDESSIFGYISIPSINVKEELRLGASYDNLDKGLGHIEGTSLPIGGESRRSVIAGHRGWYGSEKLLHANEVKKGDLLILDLGGDILKYKLVSKDLMWPDEIEKLNVVEGKDIITILTCHPIYLANQRLLLNFERVYEDIGMENIEKESKVDKRIEKIEEIGEGSGMGNFSYQYIILAVLVLVFILILVLLVKEIRKGRK